MQKKFEGVQPKSHVSVFYTLYYLEEIQVFRSMVFDLLVYL